MKAFHPRIFSCFFFVSPSPSFKNRLLVVDTGPSLLSDGAQPSIISAGLDSRGSME